MKENPDIAWFVPEKIRVVLDKPVCNLTPHGIILLMLDRIMVSSMPERVFKA